MSLWNNFFNYMLTSRNDDGFEDYLRVEHRKDYEFLKNAGCNIRSHPFYKKYRK